MNKPHRLYIFTGKGGVGKTVLAKAFTRYLQNQNINAVYLTFATSELGEVKTQNRVVEVDGIKHLALDLEKCAEGYIEKKLGSKMVASWIVKTPFFRALVNMIPGFNYLIYLGQALELLEADKSLVFVLDSPASGHAVTMIEATSNFGQIFGTGLVFEDTNKMLSRLNDPHYAKVVIAALPSQMSWQESIELKTSLGERTPISCDIVLNNSLTPLFKNQDNIPHNLQEKLSFEESLIREQKKVIKAIIPHSLQQTPEKIERDLLGSLSPLL